MSDEDKPRAKPIPERWADALRAEGLPGGLAQIGFGFVVVAAILLLGLVARFAFLVLDLTEAMDHEALRNLALVLAGLVGLPFLGWRSWAAHRQAAAAHRQSETALQTNITTRINEAVKMLGAEKSVKATERHTVWRRAPDGAIARDPDGAPLPELDAEGAPLTEYRTVERTEPNLEVRLGALYALERIAQDSLRDHVPIMETLCAYIRENSENLPERARPRIDILTALTILGRRGPDQRAQEEKRVPPYRPDLGGAKFGRNDLSRLALQGMLFVRAKMEGANLGGARLEGANFGGALLSGASLSGAMLDGTDLSWATLKVADLSAARMERADLRHARMQRANLSGAILQGANLSRARLYGASLRSANLELAILREVNLKDANLAGASLEGADFHGAIMEWVDLRGVSLSRIDFASAKLTGAAVQSKLDSEVLLVTPAQAAGVFADGTVRLAGEAARPAHWFEDKLRTSAFYNRWRDLRERGSMPWPPPNRYLDLTVNYPGTPFDSPVHDDEVDPNWTPPAP